jgi:putative endonuclease
MKLLRGKQERLKRPFNQAIGKWGEHEAARFLKRQGYKILKKNYRALGGEIDLIVSKGDVLVFVEVKSQDGKGAIRPEQRVGVLKKRQIVKIANYYISKSKNTYSETRLDVISVYRLESGPEIHHFEGAFGADY